MRPAPPNDVPDPSGGLARRISVEWGSRDLDTALVPAAPCLRACEPCRSPASTASRSSTLPPEKTSRGGRPWGLGCTEPGRWWADDEWPSDRRGTTSATVVPADRADHHVKGIRWRLGHR